MKDFATAIAKGIGHIALGKFDELPSDGADAFAALGIEQNRPESLLFLLLQRSMQSALCSLLSDSKEYLPKSIEINSLSKFLEIELDNVEISRDFFQRPSQLPAVKNVVKAIEAWLEEEGVKPHISKTIAQDFLVSFLPHCTGSGKSMAHTMMRHANTSTHLFSKPLRERLLGKLTQHAYKKFLMLEYLKNLSDYGKSTFH